MPAPDRIKQLVATFEQNIDSYHSQKNETELRRQFLDPFFEALGWDVDNKKGFDERNKEVAHEHSVEIDGQQKKADYAFRTGKDSFDFLVEAKKPSVKVESNLDAAFQVRRYGWSAGIPVNILTDFEHFAIYDCRTRPNYAKDKAATGRIEIIHYKDYVKRWDEIAALFSPDAIRKGALEKYKDDLKGKKGTQEVDDAFLEEIEAWREALARNIATRNKHKNLNEEQVNYAVQMTIDRIIFLRIAEERGMEKDRRLFELIDNTNIYKDLLKFFAQADERYNSGLFHFKKDKDRENPDTLSTELEIDDKVLKDIIKDLYYPSPYAFNYIPTEILGSVYERFLGKVIRLTAGGNAKVEEKPEVRKAGGVYYTPAYIVEYIVKNTVGKLAEGKTPEQVAQLNIVDPACGSGSFLLGAFQFLLDWHLAWYVQNDPEKSLKKKIILTEDNKTYRLSIDEKKRILLNNIHGVDLDSQAVEVTKLSLLLKVVEDPGQLKMFEEGHLLPNLNKNIKNGNALIGTDYFSGQMFGDMEEMKRVKPFDWQSEFQEVFKRGGFDAVIGNPPYVLLSPEFFNQNMLDYLNQYSVAQYKTDLFHLFTQKGIDILRNTGKLGFIIPNTWFTLQFTTNLRKYVLSNTEIEELIVFEHKVFQDANVHTGLIFLRKASPEKAHEVHVKRFDTNFSRTLLFDQAPLKFQQNDWLETPEHKFEIRQHGAEGDFISRLITEFPSLEKVARASLGCQAYNSSKHTPEQIKNRVFHADKKLTDEYLPELAGSDASRYFYERKKGQWIKYGSWLHDYRSMDWLTGPRILIREVAGKPPHSIFGCYIEDTYCNYKTILNVNPSEKTDFSMKYLLGILNSRLMSFIYPYVSNKIVSDTFPRLSVRDVKRLPIRAINFNDPAEKSMHDQMVALVEQMLGLHKSLVAAKSPQESELIQRQITSTDGKIDDLVYKLYGLTEEEIKIVE